MTEPLLDIHDLRVDYRGHRAVDGICLSLARGQTLGLLGPSGSGKSTIGNAILGLVRPTAGRILLHGNDITHTSPRDRGRHIQAVFQDPYGSLNPARTIGSMLTEPLRVVHQMNRHTASARVIEVLAQVGLPPTTTSRYPAELSGGQCQRVAIARALLPKPELIICDEPTSALDLSIQGQILNLLLSLQEQLGLSYLFISHSIPTVRHMSHHTVSLA